MRQTAASLQSFYTSPLGRLAARSLADRVGALWPDLARTRLLAAGYATPLLAGWAGARTARVAAMPAGQGATTWSAHGHGVSACLIDEYRLPFADEMFDRAIVMHGLEEASEPRALVREIWRVLAPQGRVLVIAANRLGLWSRAEHTPFGHGRPWTRAQLSRLLADTLFQTTAWTYGLHLPPLNAPIALHVSDVFESAGHALTQGMGGVVMIEAVKRLYIEPNGAVRRKIIRHVNPLPKGAAGSPKDEAPGPAVEKP